jgi:hypothetical protein
MNTIIPLIACKSNTTIFFLSYNFVISAQSFGHPFLSAYVDSLGANYSNGANFATASSTIRIPSKCFCA